MVTPACKKDKKEEPTPAAPAPTNITVELSLVEFTSYPGSAATANLVAVSPAGDTISLQAMNLMATYSSSVDITDSLACSIPLSCTVSYPLLNDGSRYTVYFRDGATAKGSIGVSYSSVISLSGVGYSKMCGTNYHRVVVGW